MPESLADSLRGWGRGPGIFVPLLLSANIKRIQVSEEFGKEDCVAVADSAK